MESDVALLLQLSRRLETFLPLYQNPISTQMILLKVLMEEPGNLLMSRQKNRSTTDH